MCLLHVPILTGDIGDPITAVASTKLTDTLGYLRTQDIVLLQELGSKNAHIHAQALLHTHTLWYSTHQQYRRGKGVAVALHKRLSNYYHSHTIHDDHQLIHLRLKHLLPSDALLHVICWYLPHSGSTQLHALDLMSRFTHLAAIVDEITATQPGSLVVIAGDLNAKVGTAMPLSTKAAGTILQHNAAYGIRKHQHISFERKQRHPDSDFSGKLLHDMCQATHLINLTGITSADSVTSCSILHQHQRWKSTETFQD